MKTETTIEMLDQETEVTYPSKISIDASLVLSDVLDTKDMIDIWFSDNYGVCPESYNFEEIDHVVKITNIVW